MEKHPWKQIFLIFDKLGGCGGEALHDWLKRVEEGKDVYKIKYEIIKRAQLDPKDISTHNAEFSCILLEKGFQGEPVREITEGHKIIYPPIKDAEEHNQILAKMHEYDTHLALLGDVVNTLKAIEGIQC